MLESQSKDLCLKNYIIDTKIANLSHVDISKLEMKMKIQHQKDMQMHIVEILAIGRR